LDAEYLGWRLVVHLTAWFESNLARCVVYLTDQTMNFTVPRRFG
jgi:hypothetical protein